MTLQQLKYIIAIAECGSITSATGKFLSYARQIVEQSELHGHLGFYVALCEITVVSCEISHKREKGCYTFFVKIRKGEMFSMVNELFLLTKSQREMLSFDVDTDADNRMNWIDMTVELKQGVSAETIEKAVNAIIRNQEAMRLQLCIRDGNYYQYKVSYHWQDLQIVEVDTEEEAARDMEKYWRGKHLIWDAPLYRIVLYISRGVQKLFIEFCHVITDGWSAGLFCMLLDQYIAAIESGAQIETTEHSYLSHVRRDFQMQKSSFKECDQAYWMEKLGEIEKLPFLGTKGAETESMKAERLIFHIHPDQKKRWIDFCDKNKFSIDMLLMTALITELYFGNQDMQKITIGQMFLNRRTREEKACLGNYASETILCVSMNRELTLGQLLKNVQMAEWEAFHHGTLLHDEIVSILHEKNEQVKAIRNVEYNHVWMNYESRYCLKPNWIFNYSLDTTIAFMLLEQNDITEISFDYQVEMLDRQEAEALIGRIFQILELILDHGDLELKEVLRRL